jgi:hypothetical protein
MYTRLWMLVAVTVLSLGGLADCGGGEDSSGLGGSNPSGGSSGAGDGGAAGGSAGSAGSSGGAAGSAGSSGGAAGSAGSSGGSAGASGAAGGGAASGGDARLRLMIETDIGGDRDDQASLIRFMLYANEFDVEGILIDRHPDQFQKDGATQNPTGAASSLEMAMDYLARYGSVHSRLSAHDPAYPPLAELAAVTVEAHDGTNAGRDLLIAALKQNDPRPLWYGNWGSNSGTTSNLKRALEWIAANEPGSYDTLRARLRVSTLDGEKPRLTLEQASGIPLYIETGWPQLGADIESRWYRRFDDITAGYLSTATDLHDFADLYTGQKEGDSWSFVLLMQNGLNVPERPEWGGAAGRYRRRAIGDQHYWNDAQDSWNGSTNRDNTAARWAKALQNDFKARLDWANQPSYASANHPPRVVLNQEPGLAPKLLSPNAGSTLTLSLAGTSDPDGDNLSFDWSHYPEAGSYAGKITIDASGETAKLTIPADAAGKQIHVIAVVADDGDPNLTRYRRVVLDVTP